MPGTPARRRPVLSKKPADANLDVSTEIDIFHNNEAKNYDRSTGVYHPSGLTESACHRELYYDRIGADPVRSNYVSELKLFALGHYIHDGIQAALLKIFPDFKSEVRVSLPSLHIEGSADGTTRDWVIELKTVGDATFKTLVRPKKDHVWQVHSYMSALGLARAQLLYINRNTGDTRNFRIKFQPEIWAKIEALIQTIEDAVAAGEPPIGVDKPYTCRGCKFLRICEPACLQKTPS